MTAPVGQNPGLLPLQTGPKPRSQQRGWGFANPTEVPLAQTWDRPQSPGPRTGGHRALDSASGCKAEPTCSLSLCFSSGAWLFSERMEVS